MMKQPMLSAPVQRALPGAAAIGGAAQAGGSWPALPFPSEGADQAWSTGASSGMFASEG